MRRASARTGCRREFWFLLAVLFLGGCASRRNPAPTLPEHHPFVPEQFILHGDVPMAEHERVVRDLTAQRAAMSRDLALPSVDAPVHVYLFDNADEFNEHRRRHHPDAPPGRAFFPRRKSPLEIYALASDRLHEDLRHEATHACLHAALWTQPLWLDEGLAEYYELPPEWNGVNRPHVDLLLDALSRGTWRPDLLRLESLRDSATLTQMDYAECWAWVHLLLNGQPARAERLREYLGELRRTGHAGRLSDRLRADGGDLRQELVDHLQRLAASGR